MGKLSLKNLKFHEDMSQETPCFSADLYEDGKLVAHVQNNGRGGSNNYAPASGLTYKDVQRFYDVETDCDIMTLAEELNIVQRKQSKALVLKKDGKYYASTYSSSFAKLRKSNPTQFGEWINEQIQKCLDDGYEVLNTNLPERTV